MNVLANPKGSVEAKVLYTPILSHRLIQNKQRNNCEATEMMARKVRVCIKNWESI
jgi:hypothetical protein